MGDWTWGLLLVALICFAYSPVGWAGFVWDDGPHLTANPTIVGPARIEGNLDHAGRLDLSARPHHVLV